MDYKRFTTPSQRLFYAVLLERTIDSDAASTLMDVAAVSLAYGAVHLYAPYQRTDMARNGFVKSFLREAKNESDVLVMMDCDHIFPRDVVVRLASQVDAEHEVIGALAFRRSKPYDPVCYRLGENGEADIPTKFSGGLEACDIMGTGTIAIRRSVFTKLDAAGSRWPYFRYTYREDSDTQRSEDWDWGLSCRDAGIKHWCDTGVVIPHITKKLISVDDWFATLKQAYEQPDSLDPVVARLGLRFSFGGNGNGTDKQHAEAVA